MNDEHRKELERLIKCNLALDRQEGADVYPKPIHVSVWERIDDLFRAETTEKLRRAEIERDSRRLIIVEVPIAGITSHDKHERAAVRLKSLAIRALDELCSCHKTKLENTIAILRHMRDLEVK
jgi:hypothetical protein